MNNQKKSEKVSFSPKNYHQAPKNNNCFKTYIYFHYRLKIIQPPTTFTLSLLYFLFFYSRILDNSFTTQKDGENPTFQSVNEIEGNRILKSSFHITVKFLIKFEQEYLQEGLIKEKKYMKNNSDIRRNACLAIFIMFCVNIFGSLVQEKMMKVPYQNPLTLQVQMFQSSNSFILLPSLFCWLIGFVFNNFISSSSSNIQIPPQNWLKCSMMTFIGTLFAVKSVYLTSYPFATFFKSTNILNIISVTFFINQIWEQKIKTKTNQIVMCIAILTGLVIYKVGEQVVSEDTDEQYEETNGLYAYTGVLLLTSSLLFDGFGSQFQAITQSKYMFSSFHIFQKVSKWQFFISLAYSILSFDLHSTVMFIIRNPSTLTHLIMYSLTDSIGQALACWISFKTSKNLAYFSISLRKIMTIIISIIYFEHRVINMHIISIIIVTCCIGYNFLDQIPKQATREPKIKIYNNPEQQSGSLLTTENYEQNTIPRTPKQIF